MSSLEVNDDDQEFEDFVSEIIEDDSDFEPDALKGDDDTLLDAETAGDAISKQDEALGNDDPDGEMPGDDAVKSEGEHKAKQDDNEYVPRKVLQKVRQERRDASRDAAQARRDAAEAKAQRAEAEERLAAYEKQMADSGIEYVPPVTEFSDDLEQRMRDGDTDAITDAVKIISNQGRAADSAEQSVDQAEPHWTEAITDAGVVDQLEAWSDAAQVGDEAGTARWGLAVDVSNEVLSDPNNQNLSPDEIGAKIVTLTKDRLVTAAAEVVERQVGGDEDRMPESLGSAGGGNQAPKSDLLGLDGDDLIAAIDKM